MNNKYLALKFLNSCLALIFITFVIISCSDSNPDISKVNIDLKIHRFDKAVNSISIDSIEKCKEIKKQYPEFYELYSYKIIGFGNPDSPNHLSLFNKFLTDYAMHYTHTEVDNEFSDISGIEKKITDALKHYKYYFPKNSIPQFYTFIGGMNQSIVVAEDILGIGLDKYMGSDWEGYERFRINNYLRKNMYPEKIRSDCMQAIALTEFEFNDSVNNVLASMVYQGMVQYFVDKMLPKVADSVKFGFNTQQMNWCINNENQMWEYLLEHKLLFNTDFMTIKKLTQDAPYTSFFTKESPGKAVIYLGYKIVGAFMDNNPDLTMEELFRIRNYQRILSKSKYNP